jgi:hypothetical protein
MFLLLGKSQPLSRLLYNQRLHCMTDCVHCMLRIEGGQL